MKRLSKLLACVVALGSLSSIAACDDLLGDFVESDSSTPQSSWEKIEESSFVPELNSTDPEKTVEREIVDDIGHKVVYYSDGSYEDLGRVEPLNFATPVPETQHGYQSLAKDKDGESLCALYKDFYTVASEFHGSKRDVTVEKDEEGGSYAVIADIDYGKYNLSDDQAMAVWKVFGDENPIFYWADIYLYCGDGEFSYLVDPAYAKYADREVANKAIKKMAEECDGYLSGLTTITERALTIYDYVLDTIDYAYEEDGVTVVEESWAYNIGGGATTGFGVCETYAETYAYLCNMFGIKCLNVVGYAGEAGDEANFGGHAWNYLCLEEKWYAVDITWADNGAFDRWYFGIPLDDYTATHKLDLPTKKWGVEYQCAMPALSGELIPVLVGEEDGEKKMLSTIDEAFKSMTNEQGRYEVILYPETTVAKKSALSIYNYGDYFTTAKLPKVAHITFVGSYQYDPVENAEYPAQLDADNKVQLQCDVTLIDAYVYLYTDMTGEEEVWIKNGYKVTEKDSEGK